MLSLVSNVHSAALTYACCSNFLIVLLINPLETDSSFAFRGPIAVRNSLQSALLHNLITLLWMLKMCDLDSNVSDRHSPALPYGILASELFTGLIYLTITTIKAVKPLKNVLCC